MSKLDINEIPEQKKSKLKFLMQTMKDIATTFSWKKQESKLEDSEIADGNNPFWIKKLNLEGHTYRQDDLIKMFDGIDKKRLETYKKICWNFENLELSTLKSKWVLLARLLDFDASHVAEPIFVETENDGTYSLEHKTNRQWANDTRIKLFEVRQIKNNKNQNIEWNAIVKLVYAKDSVCLKIDVFGGNPLIVPIKSIKQEPKAKDDIQEKSLKKTILSEIKDRLDVSQNEKVSDRVKFYLKVFAEAPSLQIAEWQIYEMQVDFANLIEWKADQWLIDRYPGWRKEDFEEIYTILYWEQI